MQQYASQKNKFSNYILFFQLGDFYELFETDAITASAQLDIQLTKRVYDGREVPMCGFPLASLQDNLRKLVTNGHKVAICNQVETTTEAKQRGVGSIIERKIERLVTPGTLTDEEQLDPNFSSFLSHTTCGDLSIGLAWLDLSTGEFKCRKTGLSELGSHLSSIRPSEILMRRETMEQDRFWDSANLAAIAGKNCCLTLFPLIATDGDSGNIDDVYDHLSLSQVERSGVELILQYVNHTQCGSKPTLRPLTQISPKDCMVIDAASRVSLELTTSSNQSRGNDTLLSKLRNTLTAAGGRELSARISAPLTDVNTINRRLETVSIFFKDLDDICDTAKRILKQCGDMERSLQRLALGRGSPRDLKCIGTTIKQASELRHVTKTFDIPYVIDPLLPNSELIDLYTSLNDALVEDKIPANINLGGFIQDGFNKFVDEKRNLRRDASEHVKAVEEEYKAELSCPPSKLSIKQNNMLGYFIEVRTSGWDIESCQRVVDSSDRLKKENGQRVVDSSDRFSENEKHETTVFECVRSSNLYRRYKTKQLSKLDVQIKNAGNDAIKLEKQIFRDLRNACVDHSKSISELSEFIATVDVHISMAEAARKLDLVKPILDNSRDLFVLDGRHIVVESAYLSNHPPITNSESFPPWTDNKTNKNTSRIWLITGPNMGGKTTFLRQCAQIACMAQSGSFVPATAARIGIVDRVFSRVGASDDISRGRSTFLVEMEETAAILASATSRSLVVIDEVGRGTAPSDGQAIAQAVLEELIQRDFPGVALRTLEVAITNTDSKTKCSSKPIFTHRVVSGIASSSYGVNVARIAGLPENVVQRATDIMVQKL
eukprot:GSMAST32.ASY1.ANO1.1383.1 assembled CDS